MSDNDFIEIKFFAEKVHAHHWPLDTPKWSDLTIKQVDEHLNNKEKKQLVIKGDSVLIDNYEFKNITKVGITIPLFKKECTMVFEGCFEKFYAHVHVTTKAKDYLEIFNKLMHWRSRYFSDSLLP
ncbi:MAG: hypothetical protein AABZ37_02290 [Thermoproteota archaeon]